MTGNNMIAMSTAVYNKYFKRYKDIRDDLINEGILGIIKGEKYFSDGKGALTTYLWVCAKRNMIAYLNKEISFRTSIASDSIEDVMAFISDENSEIVFPYNPLTEIDKIRDLVSDFKSKRKEIANDLLDCKSPKELSQKYKVTKQRISQVYVDIKTKTLENYKFEDGYLVKRSKNDKKV